MEWAECEAECSRLLSGILLRLYVEAAMFSSTRYRKESPPEDFPVCRSLRREPSLCFPLRSAFSE